MKRGKRFFPVYLSAALPAALTALDALAAAPPEAAARRAQATSPEQRIAHLERLLRSRSGERVAASADAEVQRLLAEMRTQLGSAKAALAASDAAAAQTRSLDALATFMQASRRLPEHEATDTQALVARYETARHGIEVFLQAHRRNQDVLRAAEGEAAVAAFDDAAVARLVAAAAQQADAGDYAAANERLVEAQRLVTTAIRTMLHERTLVHELRLDTPEQEYEYELRRYHGYVELIPVAIELRVPAAETVASMQAVVGRAQAMAEQAQDHAGRSDYPVAIRMLLDATDEVRVALRQAGVEM